jgi:serine/threonine protein kinase
VYHSEDIFEACPELCGQPEAALEVIYTEYVVRTELGLAPCRSDFYGRFPPWREHLERQFALHDALQDALPHAPAGGLRRSPSLVAGRGDFDILMEIGRGRAGVVYMAWQKNLRRIVALKMLRGSASGRQALPAEAEALARLIHPNIVQIYERGEWEGNLFLVLEYVDGGSLTQCWLRAPQPARAAAALVETLTRAVQYAHERGVIHRDLRPGNILLTRDGVPKIVDFGLAKLHTTDSADLPGRILGTPSYMAPEQAQGNSDGVGPAADVYSLGAILYEALTGSPPYRGDTIEQTLTQVQTLEPVPPRALAPQVPADLEAICLRCLAKNPARRYASALALDEDLVRFLRGVPVQALSPGCSVPSAADPPAVTSRSMGR